MKQQFGDLLVLAEQGQFDVIVHGCNCFCTMGAGIAKAIKEKFPEAYQADLQTVSGDRGKLGTYSQAKIQREGVEFVIINAYTQFNWRGRGIKADYAAIEQVFKSIKSEFSGLRIAYPLIGAGLAGGDWAVISKIIDHELHGEAHTLVRLI
ncbi:macro domain-containing protein [Acinetobacter sp. R933-2]|uniref:macro domain-containing protein n=1 Tax=Acinetobacter sp. R933-2 TaxID=2746728 RepID=UPI00257739F8|nr:macro domain-containing protein [Acinetobacter sp. R933-2]MDM1246513.1 macro domain-containing protein [Acinetobacter sp. R933-2]